jgi:hypothetical protein
MEDRTGARAAALHQLKGEWSQDELDALVRGINEQVEEVGSWQWDSIAEELPGHTAEQCHEKWMKRRALTFNQGHWIRSNRCGPTDTVEPRLVAFQANILATRLRGYPVSFRFLSVTLPLCLLLSSLCL